MDFLSFDNYSMSVNLKSFIQGLNPGHAIGELKKLVGGATKKDDPDMVADS